LVPIDVLPPDGNVAEQSTVPPSTPEAAEDPELPDEPELREVLEELALPDGLEEDPVTAAPLPELAEASPEAEGISEVDPGPSPPPVEEWLDDEHAASATTAALRKG
jgi:hypothetical protein